jgi:hypothetical protein
MRTRGRVGQLQSRPARLRVNGRYIRRSGYLTSSPVTARPMSIRWISDVPSKMVKIVDLGAVSAGQRPAFLRGISTDSARPSELNDGFGSALVWFRSWYEPTLRRHPWRLSRRPLLGPRPVRRPSPYTQNSCHRALSRAASVDKVLRNQPSSGNARQIRRPGHAAPSPCRRRVKTDPLWGIFWLGGVSRGREGAHGGGLG